jgi:hypothetical protein
VTRTAEPQNPFHLVIRTWRLINTASAPDTWNPTRGDLNLALKARMCLSKYPPLFFGKFRKMCDQLRAQLHPKVRRQLNSELHRELHARLHAALYHALLAKMFETSFEQTFAALFGSLFDSKYRSLRASTYLALCRQRPRGGRPPGRGVGGRIVVYA